MQFGEVEESDREVRLRPDRDAHFAVVPVHSPNEQDLPVFVDLDVMLDMENHALVDTSVELGGVMLGGQYEDDAGNPFVIVTDSLRAEHYEATKGSFKFTHETWQQITRQRERFSDDLQMIGWYHTHPDWGVFLSGMDMFICDHFFNRPLDLALVIDPCGGDRGWFHWTKEPGERIRRTGGYFLMGSRFRSSELEHFALQLKGKLDMSANYRQTGIAGSVGPQVPPVINFSDSRTSGLSVGVLAILSIQFLFLVLLTWKILLDDSEKSGVAQLTDRVEELAAEKSQLQKIAILESALELTGSENADIGKLMQKVEDLKIQVEDSTANRLYLSDQVRVLQSKTEEAIKSRNSINRKYDQALGDLKLARSEVKSLRLAAKSDSKEAGNFWDDWKLIALFSFLGIIAIVGGGLGGFFLARMKGATEAPDDELTDRSENPVAASDDEKFLADQ